MPTRKQLGLAQLHMQARALNSHPHYLQMNEFWPKILSCQNAQQACINPLPLP